MLFPFILMRHAESEHNYIKRQIKKKLNVDKIKQLPQYHEIKFCPSLKDRSITTKGIVQCQQIQQQLDWNNIEFILVSPLLRCLQTCQQLMKHNSLKCKVIVEPLLASRLGNIWSIGTPLSVLKDRFPQFTFNIESSEEEWYLKNLTEQKQKQIKEFDNPVDGLKSNAFETYEEFKDRLPRLKRMLDSHLDKVEDKKNKKILIVSHSCLLKLITAQKFKQNNKAKGISEFENAIPIYFRNEGLFKTIKFIAKL